MRLNYKRNLDIRENLDAGYPKKDIATKFGLSIATISKYADDEEFTQIQERLLKKINDIEDMVQRYKNGQTLLEIANLYDTSKQNISRQLKMANVHREDGGISKKKRENIKKAKKLSALGYKEEEIAEALGITKDVLRNYAYEEGMELYTDTKQNVETLTDEIVRLHDQGYTQHQISEIKEISQAYVSKILLKEGRRKHLTREEYKKRDENVMKLFMANGGDLEKVAEETGLNIQNVNRIVKKFI